jgi:hypothetical protein
MSRGPGSGAYGYVDMGGWIRLSYLAAPFSPSIKNGGRRPKPTPFEFRSRKDGLFGHAIARGYILVGGALSLSTTLNASTTLIL